MNEFYIFFFKQKTAYEMRISDWSSDVCSSDLVPPVPNVESNSSTYNKALLRRSDFISYMPYQLIRREHKAGQLVPVPLDGLTWHRSEIGRASCRERVCQYV